jgi:hypothetical protein
MEDDDKPWETMGNYRIANFQTNPFGIYTSL